MDVNPIFSFLLVILLGNRVTSDHSPAELARVLKSEKEDTQANIYVDSMIVNAKKLLNEKYEPYYAENLGEGVKWLNVSGLSTISRTGKAIINHRGDGLFLDVNLGFDRIVAKARFEKRFLVWVKGTLKAELKNIKLNGKLYVTIGDRIKAKLMDFYVVDWGDLTISIEDGNIIAKIIALFKRTLAKKLKQKLPEIIKNSIEKTLSKVDFDLTV